MHFYGDYIRRRSVDSRSELHSRFMLQNYFANAFFYNRDALQKAEIVRAIEVTDYQGKLVGFEEEN